MAKNTDIKWYFILNDHWLANIRDTSAIYLLYKWLYNKRVWACVWNKSKILIFETKASYLLHYNGTWNARLRETQVRHLN